MCMCDSTHAKVCVHVCAAVALLGCRLVFHSAGSARTKIRFFLPHMHTRARAPMSSYVSPASISSFNFGPHPLVCLYSCMYEWQPRTWKTVLGEGCWGPLGISPTLRVHWVRVRWTLFACRKAERPARPNPAWLTSALLVFPLAWCGATVQPQTRPINCQRCKRCNAQRL